MTREEVQFAVGSAQCAGWWYVPDRPGRSPLLVMAHGMGGTRELGLDAYARRFCAAGLCVLAFDYRHYGASGGRPRELLSIRRQLADYRAALAYARGRPEADPARTALWGFSFSGGHVMALSAEALGLRAVIAQLPFSSGRSALRSTPRAESMLLARLALADAASRALGRAPHYIPLFAPKGSTALMSNDECARDYPGLVPPEVERAGGFHNRVAASIALAIPWYEPGTKLRKPGAPVLMIVGELDTLAPAAFALDAATRSTRVELLRYPGGHFDYFRGAGLERIVTDELRFLNLHLGPITALPEAVESQPCAAPA
jgi:pimeloyl-ACP methyl ester carboxylesterase